jgi:hypothetical protein
VLVAWPHERAADIAMRILGTKTDHALPRRPLDVVRVFSPQVSVIGHWGSAQVAQELLDGDQDSVIS